MSKLNGKKRVHSLFDILRAVSFALPESRCSAQPCAKFFIEPPPDTQRQKDKEKEEYGSLWCFMPPLPSPLQLPPPTPRICRTACGHVIRISWQRETPPSHSPEAYSQFLAASAKIEDGLHLGAFEYGSWIWTAIVIMYEFFGAVIGHLEAEIDFWIFHRKWWKPRRAQRICHPQRFWQAMPVQQAGTVREWRRP